ncbi:MAG: pseudouridine synthase [Butyrivibrio sp.]|nr:pseudouridine synthase [Butyrivibrio sp.]
MANDNTAVRINKYLAQCGVCSRRDADVLIERGAVMINGNIALPGMKVMDKDKVSVNGKTVTPNEQKVVLAYYKPVGVVCTQRDRHAKVKIQDNLKYPIRLTYAGRLDKDSEGLLIMTNDGDLIEAMMRGENRHEKEYLVKVNKPLTDEAIERMRKGIYLEELDITTRACEITRLGAETMQIVLTQGLNRQIRRMCRAVGYHIRKIKRTRVMTVNLASLKPGEYRELTEEEKEKLYKECSLKS